MDEDKPPSHSQGNRSPTGDSRIDFGDLYWIPIWRGSNLTGMVVCGSSGIDSLYQHKVMDLGNGVNDK